MCDFMPLEGSARHVQTQDDEIPNLPTNSSIITSVSSAPSAAPICEEVLVKGQSISTNLYQSGRRFLLHHKIWRI